MTMKLFSPHCYFVLKHRKHILGTYTQRHTRTVLTVIFQVNLGKPVSLPIFHLHLFITWKIILIFPLTCSLQVSLVLSNSSHLHRTHILFSQLLFNNTIFLRSKVRPGLQNVSPGNSEARWKRTFCTSSSYSATQQHMIWIWQSWEAAAKFMHTQWIMQFYQLYHSVATDQNMQSFTNTNDKTTFWKDNSNLKTVLLLSSYERWLRNASSDF